MKRPIQFLLILVISVSLGCNLPAQINTPSSGVPIASSLPTTNASLPSEAATTPLPSTSTITPPYTSTPTSTITSTPSPTPNVPTALFLMNANCRKAPDKTKDAVMSFIKDESAEILGRNNDFSNTWWLVKIPKTNHKCWVSTVTVKVIGSYSDIPTIPPPY